MLEVFFIGCIFTELCLYIPKIWLFLLTYVVGGGNDGGGVSHHSMPVATNVKVVALALALTKSLTFKNKKEREHLLPH